MGAYINPNRLRAAQYVPAEEPRKTSAEVKSIEQIRRARAKRELALIDKLVNEVR